MDGCTLHAKHQPTHLTLEQHHVIPVAWMLFWQPPEDVWPDPGKDPDGRGQLWDARTVACCPTGHRNVHAWIVRLMRACTSDDPAQAIAAVKGHGSQYTTACLALERYAEVGGRLTALVAARELGQS